LAKPVDFTDTCSNTPTSVDPDRVARIDTEPTDSDNVTIIRLKDGNEIGVKEARADVVKKLIIGRYGRPKRRRGGAYTGAGYGTRRRLLFEAARDHIEESIKRGFYCEAIAISESIISDRLESRLSWLAGYDFGFWELGKLIYWLRVCEEDSGLTDLLNELDRWRTQRNGALHEMVKVADDGPVPDWQTRPPDWQVRLGELAMSARAGYELVKRLYHRVADLNPRHHDRVFPYPERNVPSAEADAAPDRAGM
jgi:hypothetical protein